MSAALYMQPTVRSQQQIEHIERMRARRRGLGADEDGSIFSSSSLFNRSKSATSSPARRKSAKGLLSRTPQPPTAANDNIFRRGQSAKTPQGQQASCGRSVSLSSFHVPSDSLAVSIHLH